MPKLEQSVFNPRNIEDLREALCHAILRRWSIPSIEPVTEDSYGNENKQEFLVHTFGSHYKVTIESVG